MIDDNSNYIIQVFENKTISILKDETNNKKRYYFKASDVAKVLDIKHIRSSIQNYDDDEKIVHNVIDLRGISQENTYLTSRGVYRLLYNSKKNIAIKFRKWVGDLLDDIIFNNDKELQKQIEFNKSLLKEKENKLQIKEIQLTQEKEYYNINIDNLKKEKMLEKHNILLREFGTIGSLVYIMKVKTYESGEYIIKIGESRRGVLSRWNEHKTNYEDAILLDCFIVNRSKDFEYFLHTHNEIKHNKVRSLENHENENELFLIGKHLTYKKILTIIESNIKNYNNTLMEVDKLKLENEKIQLEYNNLKQIENMYKNVNISESMTIYNKLFEKIDNLALRMLHGGQGNNEMTHSNKHHFFGTTFSQEYKDKLKQAHKGEKHHFYGKSFNKEHKKNLGKSISIARRQYDDNQFMELLRMKLSSLKLEEITEQFREKTSTNVSRETISRIWNGKVQPVDKDIMKSDEYLKLIKFKRIKISSLRILNDSQIEEILLLKVSKKIKK